MNRIITQGLGTNNQLVTHGYGAVVSGDIMPGAVFPIGSKLEAKFFRRKLAYEFFLPLIKESELSYPILANILVTKDLESAINVPIIKNLTKTYAIKAKINNKKLLNILKFI